MEQKNNNGVLFANEKRTSDKHPNYNGTAIVDGKPKSMSAWINKSKSGKSYMKITFQEPYKKEVATTPAKTVTFGDDDLPF